MSAPFGWGTTIHPKDTKTISISGIYYRYNEKVYLLDTSMESWICSKPAFFIIAAQNAVNV